MEMNIVSEFLATFQKSKEELLTRIGHVRYGPIEFGESTIYFYIDKVCYKGILRGKNRDYVIGASSNCDRKVVLRIILEGDYVVCGDAHV
jgi:hypothetical protein